MTAISMLYGESPKGVVTDELDSDLQVSHREVWEREINFSLLDSISCIFWFYKNILDIDKKE